MTRRSLDRAFRLSLALVASGLVALAQPPAAQPGQPGRGPGGFGRSAYPQRPPADPAVVERGKGLYSVNCGFCHGSDARGGEGGPNLLRSTVVLDDQKGELIAPIVRSGRGNGAMPAFNLPAAQVSDIVTYLHSIPVGGRDVAHSVPATIVVGDAAAGKAVFATRCASCHSVTGDLQGIATRISDPKSLQQMWLMPGGGRGGRGAPAMKTPPLTVTVTLASGEKIAGRLERVDDFLVTLVDSSGALRSYQRHGAQPRVEIHNPLQPHLDLLAQYTDRNIHDLTAYLVTLK